MERKRYKELSILNYSLQSETQRYPLKGSVKAPTCLWYRNNLCALSQRRNLLFLAYVDKIHVFKPQFPTQLLSSKPELILALPKTRAGRTGYIDPSRPHAVNQLVVSDLGFEEILVAACDDGDIIAYTTRSIFNAIEESTQDQRTGSKSTIEAKAFFLRNVRTTAWGIAVHKNARLIAVSSNLHEITVFAFALVRSQSPENLYDMENDGICKDSMTGLGHDVWNEEEFEASSSPPDRHFRNFQFVLLGHTTNTPNISFCNTEADPSGQYLVSTDISGRVFVWNVWQKKIIADLSPYREIQNKFGWGVACLDPQTYLLTDSIQATFGCDCVPKQRGTKDPVDAPGVQFDITTSTQSVPNSSVCHPSTSTLVELVSALSNPDQEMDESAESQDSEDSDFGDEYNEDSGEGVEEGLTEQGDAVLDAFMYSQDTHMQQELDPQNTSDTVPLPMPNTNQETHNALNLPRALSSDTNTELSSTPDGNANNVQENHEPLSLTLPFHVFSTTKTDVHFLYNIVYEEKTPKPTACSSVICKKILHQTLPRGMHMLSHMERLNMVLQVPELSLIAVASQTGRVALLTTTKPVDTKRYYGLRIDWFLPLQSQEQARERPEVPLMGMAIGPLQTREMLSCFTRYDSPDPDMGRGLEVRRRFRLFLVFYNHAVLTYEVSRSPASCDHGIHDRLSVRAMEP